MISSLDYIYIYIYLYYKYSTSVNWPKFCHFFYSFMLWANFDLSLSWKTMDNNVFNLIYLTIRNLHFHAAPIHYFDITDRVLQGSFKTSFLLPCNRTASRCNARFVRRYFVALNSADPGFFVRCRWSTIFLRYCSSLF